jgi:hypothetical protein
MNRKKVFEITTMCGFKTPDALPLNISRIIAQDSFSECGMKIAKYIEK